MFKTCNRQQRLIKLAEGLSLPLLPYSAQSSFPLTRAKVSFGEDLKDLPPTLPELARQVQAL